MNQNPILTPTLQRRMQEHESRFEPLNSAATEMVEANALLKEEQGRLRKSIDELTQEKQDLEQQKAQLADQVKSLAAEKEALQNSIEPIRQERDLLAAEGEAFAQEHLRHDAALKQKIREIADLAREIKKNVRP